MTTTTSLDNPHTRLPPTAPQAYIRRMIISTLHRKGAEGAEAGVISEMERLLEHHVQNLFEVAHEYAQLANRSSPNTLDLLTSHQQSSHLPRRLKRESQKRRRAIKLQIEQEPPENDNLAETITSLADAMRDMTDQGGSQGDDTRGKRLEYAFEGAPKLPPTWTYPPPPVSVPDSAPIKVTSAALNFVKTTVAEADVDPELGIVDYRSRAKKVRR